MISFRQGSALRCPYHPILLNARYIGVVHHGIGVARTRKVHVRFNEVLSHTSPVQLCFDAPTPLVSGGILVLRPAIDAGAQNP